MSERAAFQSCLAEFMVMVEDMEKVEVVRNKNEEEEVGNEVPNEVLNDVLNDVLNEVNEVVNEVDNDEDDLQSSSEEYKSARASFGSYLEDKGRHVRRNVSHLIKLLKCHCHKNPSLNFDTLVSLLVAKPQLKDNIQQT